MSTQANQTKQPTPVRVMFLCTGNSCRSQMAEGWARHLFPDSIDVCSAGTDPQGLNPRAVEAMQESGIDISRNTSNGIEACDPQTLNLVVTVCGHAHENCPVFLKQNDKTRVIHQGFDDPPALAANASTHDEAMTHYRRVRDEIKDFVANLLANHNQLNNAAGTTES